MQPLLLLGMQIRLNMGEKSAHFSLLGLRPRPRTRREAVGGVEKPTPPPAGECECPPRKTRGFRGISSPAKRAAVFHDPLVLQGNQGAFAAYPRPQSGLRYSTIPLTSFSSALSISTCLNAIFTRISNPVHTGSRSRRISTLRFRMLCWLGSKDGNEVAAGHSCIDLGSGGQQKPEACSARPDGGCR